MSAASADRNLLFGILALQMDFISRDALIASMNAWVLDKARPLGDILAAQGALDPEHRALLDALVQAHLAQHGNDPVQSLAALNPLSPVREDLRQIADPEVQASLTAASRSRLTSDPGGTASLRVGASSSPGVRFRVLRPHARGALGQVSVAIDEELHREVALKEIQRRHADHPESRARFLLEAEVTGGLEHPGVVPVYGLGTYDDGRPFYAMRFIRGDSLHNAIQAFHRAGERGAQAPRFDGLEFRQLLGRFVSVCQTVAYAHARGVLHRDLKPGNIMLGRYGETLVVDWGLAKAIGRSAGDGAATEGPLRPSSDGAWATLVGTAVGTPVYMSPEQADGRLDEFGPASDVYSLGVTLYEVLTGRQPFEGDGVEDVLAQVRRGAFAPPRQVLPAVPRPLEAVCLKAMAQEPADRYASAQALAVDIEHWLADEPVKAWREPRSLCLARWCRRKPAEAMFTFLCLTIVMMNVYLYVFWMRFRDITVASRMIDAIVRAPVLYVLGSVSMGLGVALLAFQIDAILALFSRTLRKALAARFLAVLRTGYVAGGILQPAIFAGVLWAIAARPGGQWDQWPWKACLPPIGVGAALFGAGFGLLISQALRKARAVAVGYALVCGVGCATAAMTEFCFFPLPVPQTASRAPTTPTRPAPVQLTPEQTDAFQRRMQLARLRATRLLDARVQAELGRRLSAAGQAGAAESAYRHALALYEQLAAEPAAAQVFLEPLPLWTLLREAVAAYDRLGRLLRDTDRTAEATGAAEASASLGRRVVSELDRQVSDLNRRAPQSAKSVRVGRAYALALVGDRARAIAEAEALAGADGLKGGDAYNLACTYALAASVDQGDPGPAQGYAASAVALLRQAFATGYTDVAQLLQDGDLDALRGRDDYAALLWDLADTPAARPAPAAAP
jgi:serine/threonine protein kinase